MSKKKKAQQDSDLIAEAARITGRPTDEMTIEEAEAVLFGELGKNTPRQDPAAAAAQRLTKKSIEINGRRVAGMTDNPKDVRELINEMEDAHDVQKIKYDEDQQDMQENTPDNIAIRMQALSFMMDFLRDASTALISYKLPGAEEIIREQQNNPFLIAISQVANETGADIEQIASKETRTEEQQQRIIEIMAQKQASRVDAFFNSNYMEAIRALLPIKVKFVPSDPNDEYSLHSLSVLYFFAIHYPDVTPFEPQNLTEDQMKEIRGIFGRLNDFFFEHSKDGTIGNKLFLEFIRQENPENADNITEALPLLQVIKPSNHIMPNSTLMNDLGGAKGRKPINAGGYDMPVLTKRREEITTYVMAAYEPEKGIVSSLTEYERNVSDAIMSIWEQAKRDGKPATFTEDSLYRAMPGRGEKASRQQKKSMIEITEKFTNLDLEIDATDEFRARRIINDGDTYHTKEKYLMLREHIYTPKGGKPYRGWEILQEPPVLKYSKKTGQILTVPAKCLEVEKVKHGKPSGEILAMNASRQAMTSYMLRRIAIIKYDVKKAKEDLRRYNRKRVKEKDLEELPLEAFREQSDIILFDSIFKNTGNESTNREENRRNRNFCFYVLDYWISCNLIKGYTKQSKGRSVTGIKLMV